jgi:hypothetical protein
MIPNEKAKELGITKRDAKSLEVAERSARQALEVYSDLKDVIGKPCSNEPECRQLLERIDRAKALFFSESTESD